MLSSSLLHMIVNFLLRVLDITCTVMGIFHYRKNIQNQSTKLLNTAILARWHQKYTLVTQRIHISLMYSAGQLLLLRYYAATSRRHLVKPAWFGSVLIQKMKLRLYVGCVKINWHITTSPEHRLTTSRTDVDIHLRGEKAAGVFSWEMSHQEHP